MTTEGTKVCPFCAETIQAAAIICRYCGHELDKPAAPVGSLREDRAALDREIAAYTGQGWRVVSQTDTSVQVAKPKKLNPAGMVILVLLPALGGCAWYPLWAIAVIGLVIVLVDYAVQKEELVFLTADQARAQEDQRGGEQIDPTRPPRKIAGATPSMWQCSRCGRPLHPQAEGCAYCKQRFTA